VCQLHSTPLLPVPWSLGSILMVIQSHCNAIMCCVLHGLLGCVISGHLVVEGLLVAVILFQLSSKSYKPPKKPKVRRYCSKTSCFWTLLQEMYSSKLHLCRRLMTCVMNGSQSLYALPSRRGAESTLPCWKGMCHDFASNDKVTSDLVASNTNGCSGVGKSSPQ
jgi:hypothetical protein